MGSITTTTTTTTTTIIIMTMMIIIITTIMMMMMMIIKLPPDDEYSIYLKHVEDDYRNKPRKKMHLVGPYYANISQCTVHRM
jgi:flagellar basal body-associated protein FliL